MACLCQIICFFKVWGFCASTSFTLLFLPAELFLFCLYSFLFWCSYTVFVFYLCLCAGFIVGTCAVKPTF